MKKCHLLKLAIMCTVLFEFMSTGQAVYSQDISTSPELQNAWNYYDGNTNIINDITLTSPADPNTLNLPSFSGNILNIHGNGYTINGGQLDETGYHFTYKTKVAIDNIVFENFKHTQRGTIYVKDYSNGTLDNVTMKGNAQSITDGNIWGSMVAIVDDSNGTIQNSTFQDIDLTLHVSNSGGIWDVDGGVLHVQGSQGTYGQSHASIINSKFLNNKLTSNRNIYGGAVYNEGIISEVSGSIFRGNKIIATGALSESVMNTDEGKRLKTGGFGGAFSLGSHNTGRGNATITILKDTIFENNMVSTNEGYARGGALWSGDNSIIGEIRNCTFTGNKSISEAGIAYGGAIYNNGNIKKIVGSKFENNAVESIDLHGVGGAIYSKTDLTIQDGTTFIGNTVKYEQDDGTTETISNDIHLAQGADLIITNEDPNNKEVSILGGISSSQNIESKLTVQKGAILNLSGKNDMFNGETTIKDNSVLNFTKTEHFGSFVRGTVNIENGSTVNFNNELTGENHNGLVTNLIGAGTFNKTGIGNVTISDTIDNAVKFTGNINLEGGILTVNAAPQSVKGETDFAAKIGSGTTLNYNNGAYDVSAGRNDYFTLSNASKFKFAQEDSGANLNFTGHGTYTVKEDIQNAKGNNISISNSTISFDSNEYNANYTIKESTITLQNNKVTNVIFNNKFEADKLAYQIDFDFTGNGNGDTIKANTGSATLSLNNVKAINTNNDKGQLADKSHTFKVLDGVTFSNNYQNKNFESDVYKYTISATKDGTDLSLVATALKAETLYLLNHERTDNRYFYFMGDTPYNVGKNLSTTLAGTLNVSGKDLVSSNSIITGGNQYSFFQNDIADSNLIIKNVTLQEAKGTNIAPVLDVTAASTTEFDNVVIKNNTTAGGKASAISNQGGTVSLNNVVFENNKGAENYIYNSGTMNFSTTIDRILTNGDSSKISNDGTLNFIAKNGSVYTITSAIDNKGIMKISQNSSVALSNNSGISGNGIVDIQGNLLLKDNTKDIVINSGLQGSGSLLKSDNVLTEIKGENNNNFNGNVDITAGTLKFIRTNSNTFFDKTTQITVNNAVLDYTTNRISGTLDSIFADISLQNGGTFKFSGRDDGTSQIRLNDGIVKSDTSSNNIIFKNADYILNTAFNKASGVSDNIQFNDATIRVKLDDNATQPDTYDMGKSQFTLDNSAFRFLNQIAGDKYVFNSLTMQNNSKMSLDVDLTLDNDLGKKPFADTFTSKGGAGGVVEIIRLYVTADNGIFDVVDGQQTKGVIQVFTDTANNLHVAKENQTQILSWATNVYKYGIQSASSGGNRVADSIEVIPKGTSTTGTLRELNRYELDNGGGNRGFSFIVQKDPITGDSIRNNYNIYRDLDTTSAKAFSVLGTVDDEIGKSILDGTLKEVVTTVLDSADKLHENIENGKVVSITYDDKTLYPDTDYTYNQTTKEYTIKTTAFTPAGQDKGSMFEIVNNTDFLMKDLTVQNAKRYSDDTIKEGSVIYAKNSNAVINLENVDIIDNSVDNGNGGAIANYSSKNFVIRDMKADNNTADGFGGAIYTAANMSIANSDFGVDRFNYHHDGEKNDIYIDGASTNLTYTVTQNKNHTINSGIAGNGSFIKIGDGVLNLYGNNKDFTGSLQIGSGNINFDQKTADDTYISGKTIVYHNAGITIKNDFTDITAGVFQGSGTVTKDGNKDITLTGDNSLFNGTFNINEGKVIVDTNNAKYFSGKTNIDENGILDLTAHKSTELAPINGKGILNKNGSGTLTLKGDSSGFTGDMNINNGILALAAGSSLGKIANGTFNDGTSINLQNTRAVLDESGKWVTNPNPASLQNLNFDNLILNGNIGLNIDVDLKNKLADTINADNVSGNGHLILGSGSLNVVSDTLYKDTIVKIASGAIAQNDTIILTEDAKSVMGPIQKYDVTYSGGNLGFTRQGGITPSINSINPAVMASVVATQVGGHLTQLQTLQDGFFHMDKYSKYPSTLRLAAEMTNKNAITETPVYKKSILPETSQAMWVKPYTSFEQVQLKGGTDVSNVMYGSLYGGDSDLINLGHGYKGVISAFLGYNGAHQSYNGISMDQQGGTLGLTGTLYKGNFFTGITISTGASAGEAYTQYGTDNFAMITAGAASKSGYNWEIKEGKLIIQPSLFLGYTFVNTFDYTNAAGVKMDSDPLNAIQIVPGLKIIGNLKNGWQPYAGVDMVWNIMGKTNVMANDVKLPQLSVKPYIQYGVGLQKSWGERFTAFFQTMIRNGGRNGIILTGGFRWAIGKQPTTPASKVYHEKKVIKKLERV